MTLPDGFRNVREVQAYLKDYLGFELPEGTLRRWAAEGVISAPQRRSMGRGGSFSHWGGDVPAEAAGVYVLRGGEKRRKTPRATVIKKIQEVAFGIYTHPFVVLSLADDTPDEEDPHLEAVTFELECPPYAEPFLLPYLIATEKARHRWPLERPAIVLFEWAESARGRCTAEEREEMPKTAERFASSRELLRVSVADSPHRKDELRFLVGGKDVRETLLESRRVHRASRSRYGERFEEFAGGVPRRVLESLAGHPIRLGGEKWEKVVQKYKGEVSEREQRVRLRWALHIEEA